MRMLIAALGVAFFCFSSPFTFSGETYRIEWGSHGIPHIQSESDAGVLEGQGYAQALCQAPHIFMIYAKGMGISSRYFGNSQAGLNDGYAQSDYTVQLWNVPKLAHQICSEMDPEVYALVRHFCLGINQGKQEWLNSPELPFPYRKLMQEMEVLPVHVVAAAIRSAILPIALHTIHKVAEGKDTLKDVFPTDSSNAWALIDKNGTSWLMADPHTDFGFEEEGRLIFACALDGDRLHLRGAHHLGMPFQGMGAKIGHQAEEPALAWAYTSAPPDMGDVYYMEWDVAADQYFVENTALDFVEKHYLIEFPNGPPIVGQHRYTIHGPVVKEDKVERTVYAGRGVWQVWPECLRMMDQWYRMCIARDMEDFITAMDSMAFPGGNVMIASSAIQREEKIGYILCHPTPVRDDRLDWTAPVDGSVAANLWTQVHPREWLPRVHGDQQNHLINCNCSIDITWPGFLKMNPRYPKYLIYDWGIYTYRQERARELLLKDVQASGGGDPYFEHMLAAAMDDSHGFARHLVPYITQAYKQWGDQVEDRYDYLREAVPLLDAWTRDQAAATTSTEMYLFKIWMERFKEKYHYSEFFDFPSHYPGRFNRIQGLRALEVLIDAYDCFLRQVPSKSHTWGKKHHVIRETRSGPKTWEVSGDWCCLRSAHGPELDEDYTIEVCKGQICPMIIKVSNPPEVWFCKSVDNCTWTMASWIFDDACPCTRDWAKKKFVPFPGN